MCKLICLPPSAFRSSRGNIIATACLSILLLLSFTVRTSIYISVQYRRT